MKKERDLIIKENLLTQSFLSGLVPDNLELKNISFSYDEKKILENINLSIPRGSIISIEGESGSGKSTLLDLITGLQKPSVGQILFNEEVVEEYSLTDITGYVIQDTYIFNKSLRENIALGIDPIDIDEKKVENLRRFEFNESYFFKRWFKYNVRRRGVFISGGQRQRIGIARALYKDSKILILDEATSSLDNESEEEVLNILKQKKGKVTILITAHRGQILNIADHRYKIFDKSIQPIGD